MWKNVLDKSKCLLGFHEGPWTYRRPDGCTQVQTCERCARETERVEHAWGGWTFEADGQCDLMRTCARCRQPEKRLEHSWGDSTYVRPGACERAAACTRCGASEARGVEHQFQAWVYRSDDGCTQSVACARCGDTGTQTRFQHDWDGWTASPFYGSRVRVCRHCGEMLIALAGDADADAMSMQAVEAGVNRLIAADTAEQVRAAVSGGLLTPAADKYFQFAFDQYPNDEFRSGPLTTARSVIARCREVGVDAALQEFGLERPAARTPAHAAQAGAPEPSPRAASSAPLDRRLVGHWRSTEILGAGSPFSMSIDTHCVLDDAGGLEFWSGTASGPGESESGTWTARGDELELDFSGGGSLTRQYIVEGDSMVWPGDSRYRLWHRIG